METENEEIQSAHLHIGCRWRYSIYVYDVHTSITAFYHVIPSRLQRYMKNIRLDTSLTAQVNGEVWSEHARVFVSIVHGQPPSSLSANHVLWLLWSQWSHLLIPYSC